MPPHEKKIEDRRQKSEERNPQVFRSLIIGERETLERPFYTPREERALHTLGNILRTHPTLTVEECERLYGEAQRDLRHAGQVVLSIIERDSQVRHLQRMVEAGAYQVDGEVVAERILTHAQRKDVERRMDYLEKQDQRIMEDAQEDDYTEADEEVLQDSAFRGLLFCLLIVSVAVVFGAVCDALR